MTYTITARILINARSQGEALAELEKRVRAQGPKEPIPATLVETVNIKQEPKGDRDLW